MTILMLLTRWTWCMLFICICVSMLTICCVLCLYVIVRLLYVIMHRYIYHVYDLCDLLGGSILCALLISFISNCILLSNIKLNYLAMPMSNVNYNNDFKNNNDCGF